MARAMPETLKGLRDRALLLWRIDHVVGYFGFTLMFWLAWQRRPFVLGGTLTGAAMLLEALQALTPDRHCDFEGTLYGVVEALAAAWANAHSCCEWLSGPAYRRRKKS
jgi:hypothetical protein